MDYRDTIIRKVEKELNKGTGYIKYLLRSEHGEFHVDDETLLVPAYSFTEISDLVRREFEKNNPVRKVVPIGFRGERLVSDQKELEILATGSTGLIEYWVRPVSR